MYGTSFEGRLFRGFSLGTPGDLRYLRTEFLDTLNSRAISLIDSPAPLNSYISFTVPPLSNLLGTSRSGFLPTHKVLPAIEWVKTKPAMVGHSYTGDDITRPTMHSASRSARFRWTVV